MRQLDLAASSVPMPAVLERIPWSQIKPYITQLVWRMYDDTKDQPVLTVKKWFISITLTVEQARPVFELLFGPHP